MQEVSEADMSSVLSVLMFYADPQSWHAMTDGRSQLACITREDIDDQGGGKMARDVLKTLGAKAVRVPPT